MSKIGIIYKLVSTDINIKEIYVGSTCNFRTRKFNHKGRCNNETDKAYNFNVYKYIRANGGWDTFDMIQLEEVKHDTKQQLHTRERHWIEELKATLNKIIPTRTPAEYRQINKEIINIKHAEYYADNKDELKTKRAEYYADNKDEIKIYKAKYRIKNKDIIKIKDAEYHQKNKELINIKHAEYWELNKEIINNKRAKKYDCVCGSTLRISDKATHEKTKKT